MRSKRIFRRNYMSPIQTKRTACEVYSRVTGYLRPVKQWNDGKQAEYADRKMFKVSAVSCSECDN